MNEYVVSRVGNITLNNAHILSQPSIKLTKGMILRTDNPYVVDNPDYFEPASDDDIMAAQRDNSRRDAIRKAANRGGEKAGIVGTGFKKPDNSRGGNARRRIDELHRSGVLPTHAAEKVETLVTTGTDNSRSDAAKWVEYAGSDAYARAFSRLLADPQFGHTEFTEEERDAYRKVKSLQRSLAIDTGTGSVMVPVHLDPSVILTNDGSVNPLRQISRVVQITGSEWNGVSSDGVDSSWYAESEEVTDDTPSLSAPAVKVHRGSAFVPFSFEWEGDASRGLNELQKLLADGANRLQAEAFVNGSGDGDNQPYGVNDSDTGATSVNNASGAFVTADVYTLQNSLAPRWQARARFAANLAVINRISEFETSNGHVKFPEVRDDRLLRKPLHEVSELTGDFSTTGSRFLLYGDWNEFLIVDRIGSTVELVPHLFGANRRPIGERGLLLWFRTGSRVLVRDAIKVLTKTA